MYSNVITWVVCWFVCTRGRGQWGCFLGTPPFGPCGFLVNRREALCDRRRPCYYSDVGYAYVTTQDGTSRSVAFWFILLARGWRLRVQPTAIAPYHPIRVARLDSWLKARARSSARVLKVAWRRNRLRSGGWANRHFTEAPTRPTGLDRGRAT